LIVTSYHAIDAMTFGLYGRLVEFDDAWLFDPDNENLVVSKYAGMIAGSILGPGVPGMKGDRFFRNAIIIGENMTRVQRAAKWLGATHINNGCILVCIAGKRTSRG
jgi:hypothetical protein